MGDVYEKIGERKYEVCKKKPKNDNNWVISLSKIHSEIVSKLYSKLKFSNNSHSGFCCKGAVDHYKRTKNNDMLISYDDFNEIINAQYNSKNKQKKRRRISILF